MEAPQKPQPDPATRRCLLIDLDGTLVDSLGDITASVDFVRTAYDLPHLGLDGVRPLIGDGLRVLLERSLARDGTKPDEATLQESLARYDAHHAEQCTADTTPYPGVVEQLERYREDGRRLAVVTNKPLHFAERILDHLGLSRFFDTVVGGSCAGVRKPDPAPLRLALERLGGTPEEAVMIGDGLPDLRGGRAAGTAVIAATYGFTPDARLRAEEPDRYWSAFGVAET